LAIAACKRAIAAVKEWGAPCGFINKNPCSRRKHVQSSSAAPRLARCVSSKRYPIISQTNSVKEFTPASWQRSGAVAIPWSAAVSA
jgi:hypothetical protein